MNPLEILRRGTTPLTAPVYPLRATRFLNREYFNVVYRTDAEAFARRGSRAARDRRAARAASRS